MLTFILLLYLFNLSNLVPIQEEICDTKEVDYGKTAVLHCKSIDETHNFMFWQLPDNQGDTIIGPGNIYDRAKYDYEILSGKLFIRAVSLQESGLYQCVSRGVRDDSINIRKVRMVVKKNWDEVYEHDSSVNFFRVVAVIGTLFVLIGGTFLILRNWKSRQSPPKYLLPSDEEDSAEELFPSPSTSKGNIIVDKKTSSAVYDNQGLSTDLKSILNDK